MFLMFVNLTEDVHLSITCKSNIVGYFSPWSLYVSDQNTKKVKKIFKKGVFKWNIYCLEWVYAIVNVLRSFLQFSNLKLK